MLSNLFHEILFRPLTNLLVLFYNIFGDLGLAIIAVTFVVRVILFPIAKKSLEHQKKLKQIQPKLKEIQEKHKNDKEKLSAEMMSLYKEHDFNPASGCLPMVVQVIIFIALYRVLIAGLGNLDQNQLYSWVSHPSTIKTSFLGIMDLGQKGATLNLGELFRLNFGKNGIDIINTGGVVLALIAGSAQFFQTKQMMKMMETRKKEEKALGTEIKKEESKNSLTEVKKPESDMASDMTEAMNKQMLYIFPLLTVFIGVTFPAGLALYWTTSTILMIGQQYILDKERRKMERNVA